MWMVLATLITCNYNYSAMPAGTVQLKLMADGTPVSPAQFALSGNSFSPQSVTPITPLAAGEMVHVWLDHEDPTNQVEMIVYTQPQASGQSELINHNVPMGQDVWGTCSMTAAL